MTAIDTLTDDEKRIGLLHRHGTIAATFDLSTLAGKRMAHNAIHGSKLKLKESVDTVIEVQDVLIYPRTGENKETGEVSYWTEVVLLCPGEPTYFTSSPYVLNGLKDWSSLTGPLPWVPAQKFRVCKRSTGGIREMLYLEACE
jgi:hypothetical protein